MAEQYLPLYRKYRPQEFSDLVGQENLVKAFTNAINTGKIAHAYLFCGPRGTGKTSSARILAKSLNCQNGPTLTPCGKCPSCQDILNGNMLDVVEMDAASNRSVEDAQNIIDKIHYAPVNGKFKIFIIDEVHMISKTAFNALLKTLEEPPENVIFILATTEPQKVLETIISRCQRFDFRRITVEDIVKRLKYISEKENIKISEDALFAIAKNSQGGMRDALALLDQLSVLDVENQITAQKVNEMLGKIDNQTLIDLTQNIFDKSVDNAVQKVNEIYSKGNEPLQIIENLIQYFRNLSIVKTCKDEKIAADLTLLSKDIIETMKKQAQSVSVNKIAKIIDRLTYYHKEIKYTNNRYLWLELCFIDLTSDTNEEITTVSTPMKTTENIAKVQSVAVKPVPSAPNTTNTNDAVKDVEVKENIKPANDVAEPPKQETQNNVSQPAKTISGGTDGWKQLLSFVESPPSRSFFNTFGKPVEMSENKVVVNFKDETFGNRAKEPQKIDALKKACLKYYNVSSIDVEIRVGAAPSTPKIVESQVAAQEQKKNLNETDLNTTEKPEQKFEKPTQAKPQSQNNNIDQNEDEFIDAENIKYDAKRNYSDQVKMAIDLFDAKVFD